MMHTNRNVIKDHMHVQGRKSRRSQRKTRMVRSLFCQKNILYFMVIIDKCLLYLCGAGDNNEESSIDLSEKVLYHCIVYILNPFTMFHLVFMPLTLFLYAHTTQIQFGWKLESASHV